MAYPLNIALSESVEYGISLSDALEYGITLSDATVFNITVADSEALASSLYPRDGLYPSDTLYPFNGLNLTIAESLEYSITVTTTGGS